MSFQSCSLMTLVSLIITATFSSATLSSIWNSFILLFLPKCTCPTFPAVFRCKSTKSRDLYPYCNLNVLPSIFCCLKTLVRYCKIHSHLQTDRMCQLLCQIAVFQKSCVPVSIPLWHSPHPVFTMCTFFILLIFLTFYRVTRMLWL